MKAFIERIRNNRITRIMWNLIFLFFPFLLTYFCFSFLPQIAVILLVIGILSAYILTPIYIFLCVHFKFCNTWVLPISFLLHYIYLYIDGDFILSFSLMAALYSLPFFIISLIVAIDKNIGGLGKKITMITGIIVLATLFYVYVAVCRVDILETTISRYLNDYNEYYFYTKVVSSNGIFGTVGRRIIYFKPGQKERMLEEIKEDVENSLKTLIEERSDIYREYEIANDFAYITIYTVSDITGVNDVSDMGFADSDRIRSIISLYNGIKNNESEDYGKIIRYEEFDD